LSLKRKQSNAVLCRQFIMRMIGALLTSQMHIYHLIKYDIILRSRLLAD
jgi:hypothetical protein